MKLISNLGKCALSLVLTLALFSCKDGKTSSNTPGNGTGPVGTWMIDSDATLAANQSQISFQLDSIPKANQAEARAKLEKMFKSVEGTFVFKADNSLVTTTVFNGNEMTMQGTWEITGDKIISRTEGPQGEQVSTGAIQDGLLKFQTGNDQFVVLRRDGP